MLQPTSLCIISNGKMLEIKKLNGWKLKQKAKQVFRADSICHWKKNFFGIRTPKTFFDVYELRRENATVLEVFSVLPGEWKQKCSSINQVIEFCVLYLDIVYPKHLSQEGSKTFFLVKKNERNRRSIIDAEKPGNSLSVFCVSVLGKTVLLEEQVLDNTFILFGIDCHRFIVLSHNTKAPITPRV